MQTIDISQLASLSDTLQRLQVPEDADINLRGYEIYQRAAARLQTALTNFGADPSNASKAQSLCNAMATYQTSVEMLLIRIKGLIKQAQSSPDSRAAVQRSYGPILQELLQSVNSSTYTHGVPQ